MAVPVSPPRLRDGILASRPKLSDRIGDPLLKWLAALAAVVGVGALVWIAITVFSKASPAISKYGLGFLSDTRLGSGRRPLRRRGLIFGTFASSLVLALILATPLAIPSRCS